ncbi:MAG: bifunctional homocysteine S-methyltransferase/methylenetetrahydrofolate reductase [candidate division Zixibacteria bacterium 4484_95]|nr:MAG: bifunctional homocysteine S-methyltransferase/methylenetetrahydrofolate reductase [candidate division Zixibacteria bacterium 4484_95]
MPVDFRERLKTGIVICDGAMGTYLNQKGISYDHCFDELNLSKPELILQIHQEYIDAGAEMIETNTFGANSARLSGYGLEDKVREINIGAVRIAREARDITGQDVFIAGSIGPLGKQLLPYGRISPQSAFKVFIEQVEALLEGGVDLFIVETISNLEEMELAVSAIRKVTKLPIVGQMTYTAEGKTFLGNSPEEVVSRLALLDVDVIGANCSVGPQKMLEVIEVLAEVGTGYISAQPNAGLPRLYAGRFVYFSSPDYFADYARKFVNTGAIIVGGCCGTTPEHITAVSKKLKDIHPVRNKRQTSPHIKVREIREEKTTGLMSPFMVKLLRKFVVTVEIDPPKGTNPDRLIEVVGQLKEAGVDAVNIADSPMARVRMSSLAMAYLVKQNIDIDTILHFTTRDRNLMGLQSDLIGAHAIGIRDVLALTGDPPSLGDYPNATAVYDVDSIGLVEIITKLNSGYDFSGNSIGKSTHFSIGIAVNPMAPDYQLEMNRLRRKIAAGGQYIFTQPLYDIKIINSFLDDISTYNLPIILGILPLVSYKHAEFLHYEVPGIDVPVTIRQRMKKAKSRSTEEGKLIALEIIDKIKKSVAGLYLMPSFGKFDTCLNIAKEILN